jgi:hypothetical protein
VEFRGGVEAVLRWLEVAVAVQGLKQLKEVDRS